MTRLSAKREAFCREYTVDGNATRAAVRAGYTEASAKQQGCRLLTNDDVQARVADLQAEVAERNRITVDGQVGKLEKVLQRAMELGQSAAAVQAVMGQSKHCGFLVDVHRDERQMSDAQLRATLAKHLGEDATAQLMAKLGSSSPDRDTMH